MVYDKQLSGENSGSHGRMKSVGVMLDISWYLYFHVTIFESWTLNLVLLFSFQFCNTGKILQQGQNAEC